MFEVAVAFMAVAAAFVVSWALRALFTAPVAALVWWAIPALGCPVAVHFLPIWAVIFVMTLVFGD